LIYRSNSEKFSQVPKLALKIAFVLGLALSTMPTPAAQAAVESSELTLTAQNFHIYTSGNLRFVLALNSQPLIDEFLSNPTAVFRVSLGQKISLGEKQVRALNTGTEEFVATDSLDLTIREVTRRSDGQFELIALSTDIPSGTRRIEFNGSGIYPVRVEVLIDDVSRAALLTFVNRYDPSREVRPMPINVVVALDSPITLQPDGSRLIDQPTRTKIEKVIKLLTLDSSRMTVQISPELIDGLSRSSNPDDQSLLVQLVAALGSAPIVPGPYVQFDPSAASANKQADQFNAVIEKGITTWQQVLPSTRTISSIWFARKPLDENGLDLLVKAGVRSVVMLPTSSAALGEFDNAARPYRLESNDVDLSLHLVDKNYVDQLSTPTKNAFSSATYLAAQILAQRRQIEAEGGTPALRRVVLASRDGSVINEDLIHETMLILSRVPQQVALRTMTNLPAPRLDAYKPALSKVDIASFVERATKIADLRKDTEKLRSTISPEATIWQDWNERLLVMSSDSMTDAKRDEFVSATRDQLKKIRQSVTLQEGTTFTLGSRESTLRLDLQNSSDFAMTVQVQVVSSKLRFKNEIATIQIPANGSNELVVDVVALSNGLFPVEVKIFTADGLSQLGKKIEVSARVNALAGLGQVVTGVGLLLLATWWVAHIRRKYRKKISKNHPVLRSKP
jgi:hypothetical protein